MANSIETVDQPACLDGLDAGTNLANADAKRTEKLVGPVGLFLLTIAESGERKSTCDSYFTKAIRDFEEAQAELAESILKNYNASIEAWESKRAGVKEKIRQLAKENKPTLGQEVSLQDKKKGKKNG